MFVSSSFPKANIMNAAQTAADCKENVPTKCKEEGHCIPSANGLSFPESKSASSAAYDGNEGDVYTFPDGKEWKVSAVIENPETGFRSVALQPVDSADDRVVLAFAGTNDKSKDWYHGNLPLIVADQYEQAAETARIFKAQFGDRRLILTGHSLGGGLSTYASAMNDCIPSTGINSAPIIGNANGDIIASRCYGKNHTDYNTEWELVNNFPVGFNWGEKISVYGDGSFWEGLTSFGTQRHELLHTAPCVPLPEKKIKGKITIDKEEEDKRRKEEAKKKAEERIRVNEQLDKENLIRITAGKKPLF